MTRHRRKLFIQVSEATAIGLLVLNAVLYFALVRPLRSMRASAESDYSATRARIQEARARVARLERYRVDVPRSEAELQEFLDKNIAVRRQGFSHAARMVRKMSEDSKVHLTGVSYKLTGPGKDPLAHMGLEFDVEGAFPDIMRFTHTLETSGDFFVLRSLSFTPAEGRTIAMHVSTELYLKP